VGIERVPLLCVEGETILSRTCRQLLAGGCTTVHVLAPDEVALPECADVRRALYSGAVIEDLLACVATATQGDSVLVSGGDMPLLSSEAVTALLAAGRDHEVDVVYPIVDRTAIERRFPGSRRTYLRLRDGLFTGGNVFWVRREWLLGQGPLLRELFDQRKNVLALARRFGLLFFLRVLTGWASLRYLEHHLGHVVGGRLCAAVLPYPEIAADLDKAADLETFAGFLDQW
jgi:hypothetical protein